MSAADFFCESDNKLLYEIQLQSAHELPGPAMGAGGSEANGREGTSAAPDIIALLEDGLNQSAQEGTLDDRVELYGKMATLVR